MSEHSFVPGSTEEWLARARGDFALAKIPLPRGGFYADLCFHAQQAAEKAIKAVYQHHDWVFRYVHDIGVLIAGLEDRGLEVPSGVQDCAALSRYAYQTRYPALTEPVSKSDYERAVEMASAALRWAEQVTQTS